MSDYTAHLDAFDVSDADRAEMLRVLSTAVEGQSMRAGTLLPIEGALTRDLSAGDLERYRAFRARFPSRAMFSWSPIPEVFLLLAYASTLRRPDLAIHPATTDAMHLATRPYVDSTFFRPVMMACDGKLSRLFEVMAGNNRAFFDHGTMHWEPRSPTSGTYYYDGHHAPAIRYFSSGYWPALYERFGVDGESELEEQAPDLVAVHLAWS